MKNLIGNIFIYILLMQWIRKMCKIERLIFLFFFFFLSFETNCVSEGYKVQVVDPFSNVHC